MSQIHEQGRPQPLHRYIAEKIRQYIVEQSLTPHTKIPSEVVLAAQYQVSRGTIMKALEILVQEGICYRLRPQGTFVASVPQKHSQAQEQVKEKTNSGVQTLSTSALQSPPSTIGLMLPYLSSNFLSNILLSVEMVTRVAGYTLSFAYTEFDWALEQYHINQFLRQGVAGIIIYPGDHAVEWQQDHYVSAEKQGRVEMLQHLQQQAVPFVLLDRYVPEIDCDYVVCDDQSAGYAATQHLVTLGHRHIGFISIAPQITSSGERYAGYTRCLQVHALPIDESAVLQSLHWSFSTTTQGIRTPEIDPKGYAAVCDYLRHKDRPSAVVALNDTVAWCLIKAAEEVGLRVPEDLAVVCCGGGNSEVYGKIPLTSIAQPSAEMGQQGAYLLLDRIARRSSSTRHIILPVNLVERKSSGAYQNTLLQG